MEAETLSPYRGSLRERHVHSYPILTEALIGDAQGIANCKKKQLFVLDPLGPEGNNTLVHMHMF